MLSMAVGMTKAHRKEFYQSRWVDPDW